MTTSLITFSGLATGLDSAKLVSELVRLEGAPIRRAERKQSDLGGQSQKLARVKSLLEELARAAQALDARSEALASVATSTQEGAVLATASGGASLGSFGVSVTSLATAERTYSDAFAAKDQAGLFGTGTLTLQVGGGTPVNVSVTASDTLESVVSSINASGTDVTAGLLFDGANYRLQVTANATGAANAVSFTESGTSLGLSVPANQVVAAADAVFSVDGFAMTRSTNTVTDAIPGVTLDLVAPTTGTATVAIQRDPVALEDKVQTFVDAYNAVVKAIDAEFAYTGAPRTGDSLAGDTTLRGLQARLRTTIGQTVAGLSGPYGALWQIGVTTARDGTLSVDADQLAEALADDAEAVAALLVDDPATGIAGIAAAIDGLVDEYVRPSDGILVTKMQSLDGRVGELDDQIDRMQLRIDKYEENLRREFAVLEQLVSSLQAQGAQMSAFFGQLGGSGGGFGG